MCLHRRLLLLLFCSCLVLAIGEQSILRDLDEAPVIHYTLERRDGPFGGTAWPTDRANLTYLQQQIEKTEARFNRTRREYQGNKVIRKALNEESLYSEEDMLFDNVMETGLWFTTLEIGDPRQKVPSDLDFLSADFYMLITTSHTGTKYDDYFSKSVERSNIHPYPYCAIPADLIHLPTLENSQKFNFAYCRPPKSSLSTLGPSGSKLGLAPYESVGQTHSTSLVSQMLDKKIINRPVFSIMLINSDHGVLSFGGTLAPAVELVDEQTKVQLEHVGKMEKGEIPEGTPPPKAEVTKRATTVSLDKRTVHWDSGYTWTHVQGAEGWWQVLLQGIWVDGVRVLRNQAAVLDVSAYSGIGADTD